MIRFRSYASATISSTPQTLHFSYFAATCQVPSFAHSSKGGRGELSTCLPTYLYIYIYIYTYLFI